MDIKLKQKPTGCTIIEGFPGLGLIGTISTEYLIKHLDAKSIGYIWSEDVAPVAAVHAGKVVQPFEILYSKKKNIVILHAMIDVRGLEWEIAETVALLAKTLKAKEVISLEGIMSTQPSKKIDTYYFSNSAAKMKSLSKGSGKKLEEGIIMGVTAALMLQQVKMTATGFFVETHSKLPDSRAAAQVIKALNDYLNLKIDYKPLEKAAAEFESKLKDYVSKMEETQQAAEEKTPHGRADYMG